MFHSNHSYLVVRKALWLFLLLGIFQNTQAQCLLENGSFEQFSNCSPEYTHNQITNWDNCESSNSPLGYFISPDFFSTCFDGNAVPCLHQNCVPDNFSGTQYPHSGRGYGGFGTFRIPFSDSFPTEYLQYRLNGKLDSGRCYHLRFYCANAKGKIKYASNNVGAFFSDTLVRLWQTLQTWQNVPLIRTKPDIRNQDLYAANQDWFLVEGYYTARGTEKSIAFGNFDDKDSVVIRDIDQTIAFGNYTYLYIDDVSLVACDEEIIGSEQLEVCAGDSVQLMKEPLHAHAYCNWYNKKHTPLHSGFAWWFTPTQDTVLYTIRGDSLTTCDLRYDSIIIHLKKCDTIDPPHPDTLLKIALPTAFTPNGDGQNETFYPLATKAINVQRLAIYNRWGQLVHDASIPWDGRYRGEPQPEGAYWYVVEIGGVLRKGVVTLMR